MYYSSFSCRAGSDPDLNPQSTFKARFDAFRLALSLDRRTSANLLSCLAKQASERVLIRLAEHPNIDASTLKDLAGHTCGSVRAAVAENPNTPREVLERLAADEDVDLRYSMAENHNLPLEILAILTEDSNPYVAYRAQKTMNRINPAPALVIELQSNHAPEQPQTRAM